MFKIYERYIIKKYFKNFFIVSLVFLSLAVILNIFEEISFFKDIEVNPLMPYFLTFLNAPITLFEIFPFIFLLTTQFLFYDLFKKDELNLLKTNGLNNFSIIKIIFLIAITIGIFNVLIFYNIASNLKFYYSNIKNNLSTDNKYLAMVTKSGLWIKDEIKEKKFIIKSSSIKDNFISNTVINEFNSDYNLVQIIQSKKIDIKNNKWIIYDATITKDNTTYFIEKPMIIETSFNYEKINNIFSNVSTLNIFELFDLKKDFEKLGYSSVEIFIHLLELSTTPLMYGILSILSAIIMFGMTKTNSLIVHITAGFLISVMIYYIMFFFTSLGNSGTIPVIWSVLFPILVMSIISIIGLININEK